MSFFCIAAFNAFGVEMFGAAAMFFSLSEPFDSCEIHKNEKERAYTRRVNFAMRSAVRFAK